MTTNKIALTSIIYSNVELGKNVIIEDFCIIGIPVFGMTNEKTIIGDNAIIRAGTYIYSGNKIGDVTSGTMAPSLKKAIGMGYVNKEFSKADTEIYISVRNKHLKAKVVRPPFYKN
jgi:acyl-[acyl carrier protein]--UDP-N-acetylglucosamine O-acyltransferase